MDPFDHEWWIRATCRAKYLHLESPSPMDQTVWCTIIIIVFTILLGCFARSEDCLVSWENCVPRLLPDITTNKTQTDRSFDNCNDAQSDFPQRMHSTENKEQTYVATLRENLFLPASTLLRLLISTLLLFITRPSCLSHPHARRHHNYSASRRMCICHTPCLAQLDWHLAL
ncbi:uncharacterized protein EKO05_0001121 [Ascochyta rabiei]|uniref:uncharacterized protein n=1 Tax=Didymella rabiei TaxID=5454 RepID=UPI00220C4B36|nr:uncharacterized protein EKO05_0001121 [Ascochyta rabiei]UPX10462.1 hypothetical protein EKO05_0001121 [Ascochyta rabiei]